MTRVHVAQGIVLASITVALALAAGAAHDSPEASTPENTVAVFIHAFNERDGDKLCELSPRATRQAFESAALDRPIDPDKFLRVLNRWDSDNPGHGLCVAGADAVRVRLGPIDSGAITRTARETSRLAYTTTARGRWKLIREGDTWKVGRHPRLELLAGDRKTDSRH